jgi:hypothetical protein
VGILCNQRSLGLDVIPQRGEVSRACVPAVPSFRGDIMFFWYSAYISHLFELYRSEVSSIPFLGISLFKMVLGHQRLLM